MLGVVRIERERGGQEVCDFKEARRVGWGCVVAGEGRGSGFCEAE